MLLVLRYIVNPSDAVAFRASSTSAARRSANAHSLLMRERRRVSSSAVFDSSLLKRACRRAGELERFAS